jgi:quercetin dioxygenase-like cupin family protein
VILIKKRWFQRTVFFLYGCLDNPFGKTISLTDNAGETSHRHIIIMQNEFVFDDKIEWEDLGGGIKRKIMAYDANLMMTKVAFEKGGIGALHHHFHTQMAYIESGIFEIEVAGEKKILQKGDVYYIPSDVIHGAVCMEDGVLIDIFTPMRQDFV